MNADFERLPKRMFSYRWAWEQVPRIPSHGYWGWWPYAAKKYTLMMDGQPMMVVEREERKRLTMFSRRTTQFRFLERIRSEIRNTVTDNIYRMELPNDEEPRSFGGHAL